MTKGPSEAMFRKALNEVDIAPLFAHKLSDDARNWKPADYLVWFADVINIFGATLPPAASAWFEVKETPNKTVFPIADIRPAQQRGISTAAQLRIPYLIAIRWKPDGHWSLIDAVRLMGWWPDHAAAASPTPTGVSRTLLESRFGVGCTVGQLPAMVRAALIEGL
jgi:hypothetical protein